jgi:hypothetical protein
MPTTLYERASQIIAVDYTRLYKQIKFPLNQANFEEATRRNKTEMMHYAGSTVTQGFIVAHVRQCLEVAVGYLCLGPDVTPDAMDFGLHLVAFMFYTQPTNAGIPVQLAITVPVLNSITDYIASSPRAPQLRPILKALLKDQALHVAPAVNNSMAIRAVLTAHGLLGAPLVNVDELLTAEGEEEPVTRHKEEWTAYMQARKGILL